MCDCELVCVTVSVEERKGEKGKGTREKKQEGLVGQLRE